MSNTSFKLRLLRPTKLTALHWQKWDELQTLEPTLCSPYFRPEFTQAVARVRTDVEVAVVERGNQVVAFWPFQRDSLNLGRPVGGKLNDYHGLIADTATAAEIDPVWLVNAARLSGWDFNHLPANQTCFAPHSHSTAISRQLDLSQGFEAYVAQRREAGTDAIKKAMQHQRRMIRDVGPIHFEPDTRDASVFETLIRWKSAQYVRTGLADVFAFPWTIELLQDLQRLSSPQLSLEMAALWCGEELAAAMLSLRTGKVVHAWFPAYNVRLQAYAPGMQLFVELARQCETRDFHTLDLGTGDERYKISLSNAGPTMMIGSIERPSLAVWLRSGWRSTRKQLESSSWGKVAGAPLRLLTPMRQWLAMR